MLAWLWQVQGRAFNFSLLKLSLDKMMRSKALASNAGWALAGADGPWNPFNDNFSFSLLLLKFPLQKLCL